MLAALAGRRARRRAASRRRSLRVRPGPLRRPAAVDAWRAWPASGPRRRVLDVCAGLGGPARFLASRRGCRVVALELNAGRAAAAPPGSPAWWPRRRRRRSSGDATALPFAGGALRRLREPGGAAAHRRQAAGPGRVPRVLARRRTGLHRLDLASRDSATASATSSGGVDGRHHASNPRRLSRPARPGRVPRDGRRGSHARVAHRS